MKSEQRQQQGIKAFEAADINVEKSEWESEKVDSRRK